MYPEAPPGSAGNLEPTSSTGESSPAREVERLCLILSTEAGVSILPLPAEGAVVLGRAPGADVLVLDPSVSRRHARLAIGERIVLTDLGSSNGTKVDERRLDANEECSLRIGSSFWLGSTTVVLQRAQSFAGQSAPPAVAREGDDRLDLPPGVIVRDAAMLRMYALLRVVAPSPLNVLVLGETGVGKEVFAEAVHRASKRASKPFLQLNCAAIPASLLEGELFGYEKGAFTGASQAKAGLFESADGGTVFLDEIGEVPLETQAKLLRVLESGQVLRLGSLRPRHVDVRFVAATNRDLKTQIVDGKFRPDLFFRLNGITLTLPPLRKRVDDVLPLAEHFARRVAEHMGTRAPAVSSPAAQVLRKHAWPGNVRELKNVMERAVVMCQGGLIEPGHLLLGEEVGAMDTMAPSAPEPAESPAPSTTSVPGPPAVPTFGDAGPAAVGLHSRLQAYEKDLIVDALGKCGGNQTRAAAMLGITRRLLMLRMEHYGLPRPRKKS